ncbi:MAG: hypothetical protein RRY29_04025 [Desulfovibrionaceae bacterium]
MAKPNSRSANTFDESPKMMELKALRKNQRESSQRIEELKLRLFQISERHMDQTISIIKQWVRP